MFRTAGAIIRIHGQETFPLSRTSHRLSRNVKNDSRPLKILRVVETVHHVYTLRREGPGTGVRGRFEVMLGCVLLRRQKVKESSDSWMKGHMKIEGKNDTDGLCAMFNPKKSRWRPEMQIKSNQPQTLYEPNTCISHVLCYVRYALRDVLSNMPAICDE